MNHQNNGHTIPVAKPCTELEEAWSLFFGENNSLSKEDETLFAEKLASHLPALDQRLVKNAWQWCMKESKDMPKYCDKSDVAVDCVHPGFTYLFWAAQEGGNGGVYNYLKATEDYATSSFAFRCEGGWDRPCDQTTKIATSPFVAVTLVEGLDPFAVLDMHDSHPYGGRQSTCAMATTATAHAISLCIEKEHYRDVALPFCIVRGSICSLYITTLSDDGVPCIKLVGYPDGGNGKGIQLHPSPSMTRKKVFVALAVFLNKFNVLFQTHGREQYRRLLRKQIQPTNPVPTIYKQGRITTKDIDRTGYEGERRKYRPGWLLEEDAQRAASCGGMFSNVEYALDRILRFSYEGEIWHDQTKSPYYFRGCVTSDIVGMTTKDVFLKVWDSNDRRFSKGDRERRYHKLAFDAGVPVAFPVLDEIARSKLSDGIEYYVFVTEYQDEDAIGTAEELLHFSISLIETVLKLHNQAGILHCGLKPDNVRWNNGVVKLIDFESAQKIEGAIWYPGPRYYTAPEVVREEPCSKKSEAYSVGATIRDMRHKLTGEHQVDREEKICQILDKAVGEMIEYDPDSRWSLQRALDHIRKKTRYLTSKKRVPDGSLRMRTRFCCNRK